MTMLRRVSYGVNVSNFVRRELEISDDSCNYIPWKGQMLCLLKSQDLLGFTEASEPPKKMKSEDCVVWRRNEKLVKGWILGAVSDELVRACVGFDTARHVWLELEQMFARSKWAPLPPEEEEDPEFDDLQGWKYGTDLHLAVDKGDLERVKLRVQKYSDRELKLKDMHGNSALHIAALTGNTAAAKILVHRLPALLNQPTSRDGGRRLPIHDAVRSSHKETLEFFIKHTDDFNSSNGVLLLCDVIDAGFYDIALSLIKKWPDLVRMRHDESDMSALERLSRRELAFESGARFNFWERLIIYSFGNVQLEKEIPRPQTSDIEAAPDRVVGDVQLEKEIGPRPQTSGIEAAPGRVVGDVQLEKEIGPRPQTSDIEAAPDRVVPQRRRILAKKMMCIQAFGLLTTLCYNKGNEEHKAICNSAMMMAARIGIPEVVETIAEEFPDTVYKFFQISAENRSEKVFNIIYETRDQKHRYSDLRDSSGNTVLHLVAKLAPPHKLNLVSGAALQMQRELQWFKEVENFVHLYAREEENYDGKTPKMIFTEEHKRLKEEGEKWMKDTANSYIIVAALIVTVVFAAAITVPGGNDSNSGYPMLIKKEAFIVFAISDVGSLFTSITSLLMFLSIMTSRYAEEDFLYALPKRLCIGLFTLFLSIILLMVAFCASTYVVLGRERKWVLILVVALAALPVASFVFLQFPLLWTVVSSTYGRGIFDKKIRDSPFY